MIFFSLRKYYSLPLSTEKAPEQWPRRDSGSCNAQSTVSEPTPLQGTGLLEKQPISHSGQEMHEQSLERTRGEEAVRNS